MAKFPRLGSKVRRLRLAHELSQVNAAMRLGISASYLNLIEHNQRPLTVALLFKVGQLFNVDLRDWAEGDEARIAMAVREVLNDPILSETAVSDDEISEAAAAMPNLSQAMSELYAAYRRALDNVNKLGDQLSEQAMASGATMEMRSVLTSIKSFSEILREHKDLAEDQRSQFLSILVEESDRLTAVMDEGMKASEARRLRTPLDERQPAEEISRFIELHDHYFPELEAAAEELAGGWDANAFDLPQKLSQELADRWNVEVSFSAVNRLNTANTDSANSPPPPAGQLIVDPDRPVAEISADLAGHVCRLAHGDLLTSRLTESGDLDGERSALLAAVLESYFATAVVMPYAAFHDEAVASGYDFAHLARRFRVSPLAAARRLTSLRRPGASGIAFHFLRVDVAGNVRERITGSGMPLPRFGGTCPRWNIHHAFSRPGQTLTQTVSMPDGAAYFCMSRTDDATMPKQPGFGPQLAFSLGCALRDAPALSDYSTIESHGRDEGIPVGLNCRVCPRPACPDRAFHSAVASGAITRSPAAL